MMKFIFVLVLLRCCSGALNAAWRQLEEHAVSMWSIHLGVLLADDERSKEMCLEGPSGLLHLDWSRQKVTAKTMALLELLGEEARVPAKLKKMREMEIVNPTENRAASHHAREDLPEVFAFADDVRAKGEIAAVVVAGIGGSRLGPELAVRALEDGRLDIRFLSSVEKSAFDEATRGLDPRRTLVIISSKSFTTVETAINADKLRRWLPQSVARRNLVACAANVDEAKKFLLSSSSSQDDDFDDDDDDDIQKRIFPFSKDVGGRFSVSASPGLLPLALAVGSTKTRQFLAGMREVDANVFDDEVPLRRKVPFVLAALGVWNTRCLNREQLGGPRLSARAVVPYCHRLALLPAHVQQLEMESLGKSVTADGKAFATARQLQTDVVFGAQGTDCQHSFFQLLHQGAATVPCDFVAALEDDDEDDDCKDELMAHFFAQADTLALGNNDVYFFRRRESRRQAIRKKVSLRESLPGDRPSCSLLLRKLDPESVGALIAVYEHRTAITGFLLDVNPFDQPGVEHGKTLARAIRRAFFADTTTAKDQHGATPLSTRRLLGRYLALKLEKRRRYFPTSSESK